MLDYALIACALVSCVGTMALIGLHSADRTLRQRPQRIQWN